LRLERPRVGIDRAEKGETEGPRPFSRSTVKSRDSRETCSSNSGRRRGGQSRRAIRVKDLRCPPWSESTSRINYNTPSIVVISRVKSLALVDQLVELLVELVELRRVKHREFDPRTLRQARHHKQSTVITTKQLTVHLGNSRLSDTTSTTESTKSQTYARRDRSLARFLCCFFITCSNHVRAMSLVALPRAVPQTPNYAQLRASYTRGSVPNFLIVQHSFNASITGLKAKFQQHAAAGKELD
jgi:hypothetical protein